MRMKLVPPVQHEEKEVCWYPWLKAEGGILTPHLKAAQVKTKFNSISQIQRAVSTTLGLYFLQLNIFSPVISLSK